MGTQKLKAAVISAGMIANSGHIPAYKAFSQDVSLGGRVRPERVGRKGHCPAS